MRITRLLVYDAWRLGKIPSNNRYRILVFKFNSNIIVTSSLDKLLLDHPPFSKSGLSAAYNALKRESVGLVLKFGGGVIVIHWCN